MPPLSVCWRYPVRALGGPRCRFRFARAEIYTRQLGERFLNQAEFRHIGKPLLRKEDQRLLTGQGRFTDDFNLPGQAYAVMVRSPHPHAVIRHIELALAASMPGVLGIYTGADCAAAGLGPIDHSPLPKTRYDIKLTAPDGGDVFTGPHFVLPTDRARHVGEAVAMVVAANSAQALDAAEAVDIDYELLEWVLTCETALAEKAPSVWDERPDNLFIDSCFGDKAATDTAFESAAHVVEARYHIGRVTGVPLEPRAALADFNTETGRYTLYAGSGGAVRQKRELSGVLGIDPERLQVLSHDVGGNFGTRNRVFVEFALVLWAAGQLKRPVKFTATRSEAFLSDYQGRDLVTEVSLALDASGRFLAMRAANLSNVGARCVSLSPLGKGAGLITGSYHIPVASLRAQAVFTNTMPTQAYRSSGRPEVVFAIERLVDKAARQCGFDPIELRRKNLVPAEAMPYTTAVGTTYDSRTYAAHLDTMRQWAELDTLPERRAAARARGKRLGLGIAMYVESSIGAPHERAEITVLPGAIVEVVIGTQPSGQGHETSFAQVVADALDVSFETVQIVLGDTDRVSLGGGSHSGRSMRHAGTVMVLAAGDLIERGRQIASLVFAVDLDQVIFAQGRFEVAHTNFTLDWEALRAEAERRELPAELADGLSVARTNEMHDPVFPNGCAACEVEVDPDTGEVVITRYGAVDDVGRCINPLIVHGQTHGAIAQGVGQAMWEAVVLDSDTGQPVTASFMDYAMPRADHFPSFFTVVAEVLSPTNPLGIKAGGEGGTTPALAVMVSAVTDALAEYGVHELNMPLTSQSIWHAIRAAPTSITKE